MTGQAHQRIARRKQLHLVLLYPGGSLGLQLISAMPTRGPGGLRSEFHREFSYSRAGVDVMKGELNFIIKCDEHHCKKDRMREM